MSGVRLWVHALVGCSGHPLWHKSPSVSRTSPPRPTCSRQSCCQPFASPVGQLPRPRLYPRSRRKGHRLSVEVKRRGGSYRHLSMGSTSSWATRRAQGVTKRHSRHWVGWRGEERKSGARCEREPPHMGGIRRGTESVGLGSYLCSFGPAALCFKGVNI